MTTRAQWFDLAAKCEAAGESNAVLDAQIAFASGAMQLRARDDGTWAVFDPRDSVPRLAVMSMMTPREGGVEAASLDAAEAWSSSVVRQTYTSSIDAIRDLICVTLPGFWHTSGECALTGHATIGPDYNGPRGATLKANWPEDQFHDGFSSDICDGERRQERALCTAFCLAMAAKEGGE